MASHCMECGGDSIPHGLTYATIWIDDFIRPLTTPGPIRRFLSRGLYALERQITPHILQGTVLLGLAKKVEAHDEKTMLLGRVLWDEAHLRGITMWEWRLFNLARNIFVAHIPTKNGTRTIAFEGLPVPLEYEHVWWMDDKAELKPRFQKRGLPVARGGAISSLSQAKKLYKTLTPPVIVKPHSGSGSRHTVLHIDIPTELERSFIVAKQVSPKVVVEEELVGPVYRATVVNGVFVAALRRDPPHVVGDGMHTIQELVVEENKNPKRHGPYFHEMKLDDEALQELAWKGYSPETVLPQDEWANLHQKVNWALGGTTADATEDVHLENVTLFERVARELNAAIVGIDFIISDISKPWTSQERCGILECNSMPFFDNHHLPFEGEPRNVAAAIWAMNGA